MEFVVKTGKPHFFGSIILKAGRKRKQGDLFTVCKTVVEAIVFAVNVVHAIQLSALFNKAGIKADYVECQIEDVGIDEMIVFRVI